MQLTHGGDMRKTIVYRLNDKDTELNKELKALEPNHSKTLRYAYTKLDIAWNGIKLAFVDYDSKWTSIYLCEKFNEAMKRK